MIDPTLTQLIQFGHDVTRWHTMTNIKEQNLADHSWGVAMIVSRLYNGDDKLSVIQAALEHDLVEKHIGDMPRPGRSADHRDMENNVAVQMGIYHPRNLPPAGQIFLEWADLIEAGMHAQREYMLGNVRYGEVLGRVQTYLEQAVDIPPPLRYFAKEAGLLS